MSEPDPVQCATCGFLSKRAPSHRRADGTGPVRADPRFYEVESDERERVERALAFNSGSNPRFGELRMELVCYREATSLPHEIDGELRQMAEGPLPAVAAWRVIHRERQCRHWYRHEIGLDPHEHLMKLIAENVENERRDFDRRMEESRKEFLLKIDERNQSLMWKTIAVGVVGVLVALCAVFLAAGPGSIGFMLADKVFHISPKLSPPLPEVMD